MISNVDPQSDGAGSDLVAQVEQLFSPDGILSRAKNFEYRPQQQRMAVAVAKTLEGRTHLVVEAGTGVGKSLAYPQSHRLHAHHQSAGTTHAKRFADAGESAAGQVQLHNA